MTSLRSPLTYMGGKFHLKDWIISHFDYTATTFVELFGGSAHILFAKPPHKVEIYNDINKDLVNFFLVLRNKGEELARELEKIPYARKIWEKWSKEPPPKDPMERAIRYFYVLRSSFSGTGKGWSYALQSNSARDYFSVIDLLKFCQQRIKNVQIECKHYKKLLKNVEQTQQENILIYADPPYYDIDKYYPAYSFKKEDHEQLAELLNKLKCKIIISYYDHPEVRKLYPETTGWKYIKKVVPKASTYSKLGGKKPMGEEILIMNYLPELRLFDYI